MTPFEGDGVWLGCALHAHTTNSDGELPPEMLVRHYEVGRLRCRGARANAGRLRYPNASTILERDSDGLITLARRERPPLAPFGRVEVSDTAGNRAWTNPLWIAQA